MKLAAVLGALVGCAAAQQSQPSGYAVHQTRVDQHEAKAMRADREQRIANGNPPTYACGDTVLADQTTSGGERLDLAVPCFDVTDESAVHLRHKADVERVAANQDRQMAANLAEAELHSCHGITERERQHSPFEHKRAIAEVAPLRVGSEVRGVRIAFKPVAGLTAQWMERAIQCHQARFVVLGQPASYLPDDPTLVPGSHVTVTEKDHMIEVVVETPDRDSAQLALQRAKDLLAPEAAAR